MNNITILSAQSIDNSNITIINIQNINNKLDRHHLIYKIINIKNNHFYIGKHSTNNPLDDYMGSGIILRDAEHTYGLSSFIKEILFDFENENDAYLKEIELVPETSCHQYNESCYNMKPGGFGGCTSEAAMKGVQTRQMHNYKHSEETKQKISIANKGRKRTEQQKQNMRNHQPNRFGVNHPLYGKIGKENPLYGRKRPKAVCLKISQNRKYKYGKDNHTFGRKKMIPPNSVSNTKGILVKAKDIDKYLKLGYTFSKFSSYKNN